MLAEAPLDSPPESAEILPLRFSAFQDCNSGMDRSISLPFSSETNVAGVSPARGFAKANLPEEFFHNFSVTNRGVSALLR
jgi:hypothetical protein